MSGNRILWGQIILVLAVVAMEGLAARFSAAARAALVRAGAGHSRLLSTGVLLVVVCLRRVCALGFRRRGVHRSIRQVHRTALDPDPLEGPRGPPTICAPCYPAARSRWSLDCLSAGSADRHRPPTAAAMARSAGRRPASIDPISTMRPMLMSSIPAGSMPATWWVQPSTPSMMRDKFSPSSSERSLSMMRPTIGSEGARS
jgi:hypothetical protein